MKDVAIVGLPYSGKSTVWSAVARSHAVAGDRKAHVSVVAVPDPRVDELARMHQSARSVHAQLRLVDTPGLEARGLADARESDALAIVLRGFGDEADPAADLARFRAELAVADLQTMENVLDRARRLAKAGTKETKADVELYERAEAVLSDDRWLAEEPWEPEEHRRLALMTPLTLKPVLHVVNVDEAHEGGTDAPDPSMTIRGLLESEAADLEPDEADGLLKEFGVEESATDRFVRSVYALLDLVTFFSVGEKMAHAWEVPRGTKAPQAAGSIHTDFERGFIRCEVESYDDLASAGSWEAARERGLMRIEGRDYEIREGDIVHIRHS